MRVTYRYADNKAYWTRRWTAVPADSPMESRNTYPLKYAELAIASNDGRILEAGCGAGRILRYFHDRGHEIVGMDFVEIAVAKLKTADPTVVVGTGDITSLPFADEAFRYVLAFGLYHNLETGLDRAVAETQRVLKAGGLVCASFRADNLQTRLTDWLADRQMKRRGTPRGNRAFHKMNLTRREFSKLFSGAGFEVQALYPVENMPILYKFALFRASAHKTFNENVARRDGYRLSPLGRILQNAAMRLFPYQFCNIYVIIARKHA